MEVLSKLSTNKRRGGVALLLTLAAFGVSGCGANYSGEGNYFDALGKVTDPGDHSLKANIYEVKEASGAAQDWFDDHGEHQLHDNCECGGGLFTGHETVGHVENRYGYEIAPDSVAIGACVEFIGRIRANQQGKTSEDRPVYEIAREIAC